MAKALFLDRDGVINRERGDYTYRFEDFEFVEGIFDLLHAALEKGYLLIVITNQGGVAKGLYSMQDVDRLHAHMSEELQKRGITLDDIYVSPYHQSVSDSLSRKPDSQMIEKAIHVHKVDATDSYFIGDADRDMQAASKAGVAGIRVKANQDMRTVIDRIR